MEKSETTLPIASSLKGKLSLAAKYELCQQWKESGMTMRDFCKVHGVPVSTFYGWYRKERPKISDQKKSNWVPVVSNNKKPVVTEEQVIIELSLPNNIVARVKIASPKVALFIQEICHAVAIIR